VLLRHTRMLLRQRVTAEPWWAPAAGGVELRDAAGPHVQEMRFLAPMAEMDTYLAWLRSSVHIETRTLSSLDEARAAVVVNATGLAAGVLCADPDVQPARGHIVLVDNPGLDESIRDEDNPAGITYVHPRSRDVVLGGTFEPGRADTGPDPAEAAAIVERCVALVPRLAGCRIRGERIGLRPLRRGGPRVTAEPAAGGGRLVHAYGHGGAGMTLAWGCADEVAGLAG
jgi:D-amino-acid oxidase